MAGLIWLWNQGGAAGGDEVLAAACYQATGWYVQQVDQDTEEIEDFWGGTIADSQTTLDSWPAVFVGPPAPDAVQASQDYSDDYPHGHDPEDAWWGNVYGFPDQAADVVPQLFPPVQAEPIETFAAQPHFGDDFATLVPVETEDYQRSPEQNEWLAPPEAFVPELLAAQPLTEQPWFPEQEVEDYLAPPEQNEAFAPPEVPFTELLAVQPHFGEWVWPEDQTEDYQADSSLDVTPAFYPVAPEAIEVWAAQPHCGEWFYEDQPTEDYQNESTLDTGWFFAETPVETYATQPHFGEAFWPEAETEDYQPEVDITPFLFPTAPEPIETFASQLHYGEWVWEEPQTEDYQSESTLDVTPQFYPPAFVEPDETYAAQPHFGEWLWLAEETEDYQNTSALDVSPLTFETPASIAELVSANYSTFYGTVEALESEALTIEDYGSPTAMDTAFLPILLSAAADPVKGPTRKQSLGGTSTSTVPLTGPAQTTPLGGGTDTEELAGPSRAERIGDAGNDMEEV